jgi:cyclopropane-fatty-acyl-phospholipid synthase
MFGLFSKQYIVDVFLCFQFILPDFLIRYLLRCLLRFSDTSKNEKRESHIVEKIQKCENTTYEVEKANEQHYEVPTEFFLGHLGPKLKYSSCEWEKNLNCSLDHAENMTIQKYQQHLKLNELQEGDKILEIGNGWGSLCLSNAKAFPHLQFESFSNSKTQIEYIQTQIALYKLTNLKIWKQDIDDFVKENKATEKKYSRVVSIECIEHCRGYALLFEKIHRILLDDGFCFFHILANTKHTMIQSKNTWMGRNFFSGGTIPRVDLFSRFNKHLKVYDTKTINGKEYSKTLDAWLQRMYENPKIPSILRSNYEFQKWRLFYLLCSESFRYNNGEDYLVAYLFMKKS